MHTWRHGRQSTLNYEPKMSITMIIKKIKKLANRGGVGDCWPLQRKHAGSTKPYQGLSNHILSLLRLSSIMLGPRGKSRDNPGHFQPLHLQSFPRLKGVIIVELIAFDNVLILLALQLELLRTHSTVLQRSGVFVRLFVVWKETNEQKLSTMWVPGFVFCWSIAYTWTKWCYWY